MPKPIRLAAFALACIAVCGMFGAMFAAPLCRTSVRFALYENGYLYEAANDRGIDKEIALELARRSGCRFEFVVIWRE